MTSIKDIIYFLGLKAKEKTTPSMDGTIQAYYEGRQKAYNHCKEILEGYMKQFTTNEQKMTREEIIDSILLCIEIEGDGGCSSFKNEEKEQMYSFINTLKQQPTLPSNVDEAAKAYAIEKYGKSDDDDYVDRSGRGLCNAVGCEAFKAGAEWMAKHKVIWHDANDEQPDGTKTVITYNPETKFVETLRNCNEVFAGNKWCYVDDCLKDL